MKPPILTQHVKDRFKERFPNKSLTETVAAATPLFADKWLVQAKETCTDPSHLYDYDRGLLKLWGLPSEGIVFVWREGLFVTVLDFGKQPATSDSHSEPNGLTPEDMLAMIEILRRKLGLTLAGAKLLLTKERLGK